MTTSSWERLDASHYEEEMHLVYDEHNAGLIQLRRMKEQEGGLYKTAPSHPYGLSWIEVGDRWDELTRLSLQLEPYPSSSAATEKRLTDIENKLDGVVNIIRETLEQLVEARESFQGEDPLETLEWEGQLAMLPTLDEVTGVVRNLPVEQLRDYSIAITTIAVDLFRSWSLDLQALRDLNGWYATAEEIAVLGDRVDEILALRGEMTPNGN